MFHSKYYFNNSLPLLLKNVIKAISNNILRLIQFFVKISSICRLLSIVVSLMMKSHSAFLYRNSVTGDRIDIFVK